jgi:Ca-activated chloride channel family protein
MNQLLAILLAGVAFAGQAQDLRRPWPRRPSMPPRIIVPSRPQEPGQPMELREMEIRARIVGLHVEATTTMTFFNPNGRQLEGELQFPLPDGAVVTGYALDINGRMVDGAVVKKEKARVAFETETRRRVDPGLVEHVAGNVYRTRIYPLPPRGTRRIQITSVAELPADQKGDAACLLPMPIGETVARLTIYVEVSQGIVKPEIGGFGNLRFQGFNNLWTAQTEVRNARPGEDVWVALPRLPAQVIALERTADGDVWFALSDLYVPAAQAAQPPRKLGIAWDASGSRAGEHLQKEIAALKMLGVELSVLIFRDRPEELRALPYPDTLENVPYDGGTDLAAAADAIRQSDIDRWLLFTDGFDTLSGRRPDFGGKNVIAVVSQTVAHREMLREACTEVIDLQRLDATSLLRPPVRLVRVRGLGIGEVQGVGATVGGRVNLHGKLAADETELRLEYSDGHQSPPVKLSKKTAAHGALLASVWAAQRVNQLAVRADTNEDELLALGRRFGIVSPATSLLVLENLDQYVRHDIEPPASQPDLRRQWRERKTSLAQEEKRKSASKLRRVLAMWRQRVAWWERHYEVSPDFQYRGGRERTAREKEGFDIPRSRAAPPRQGPIRRSPGGARSPRGGRGMGGMGGYGGGMMGGMGGMGGGMMGGAGGTRSPERPMPAVREAPREEKAEEAPAPEVLVPATITVQAWDPATPYLSALKAAAKADRYAVYLEQRRRFAASPAFFLDCAEFFLRQGDTALGIRVLTNLAELKLEEASLLRVLAWRLQQAGELDRAIVILRKVRRLRPEEPQSHRDLALALAESGQTAEAMDLFVKVVTDVWDERFPEIEVIALEELNALLARTNSPAPASLDPRLIKNLDVDVRIVMSWDADATDVDLHVLEPSGEEAAFDHNRTTIGGLVSKDFTQGYGPEEYLVHRAMPGPFRIFAHYYGSRQQTVIGPATITATVFTDFGRPTEKKQVLALRLDQPHDRADIGEIQIGKPGEPAGQVKEGNRDDGAPPVSRDTFRAIRVGRSAEELKRLVGEPQRQEGPLWIYRCRDRQYEILMSDTYHVRSVVEILPGGARLILVQ